MAGVGSLGGAPEAGAGVAAGGAGIWRVNVEGGRIAGAMRGGCAGFFAGKAWANGEGRSGDIGPLAFLRTTGAPGGASHENAALVEMRIGEASQ